MLEIEDLNTYYGTSQALFGLAMTVEKGTVTTLIGRNGMGKTTTINSIMGIVPSEKGAIRFLGDEIRGLPSYQIAQKGIGLVPEGRQIFPNLTVRENLIATAANFSQSKKTWTLESVLEFFPALKDKLDNMGNQLSGGEQQMLAIGRALMLNPQLLILDEATEGLAPLIREQIWLRLSELKQSGLTILLIDKNLDALTRIADQHYIIEKGKTVWQGTSDQLTRSPELRTRYLGV
ncbi:MAG: ATP-binding cassette domain-containing protein [Gammaproteobacteria bacterium]|nr:ATP-binding cassette domain-containing protein [Gammaproteobacteria bacterium]